MRSWSIADTPYPKKTHRLPTILSQAEVAQIARVRLSTNVSRRNNNRIARGRESSSLNDLVQVQMKDKFMELVSGCQLRRNLRA